MNTQEFRNLDVWGIYRDPEHVLDALKIIAEHKAEITEENPLILFTNCSSKFTINGKEIGRYMDTLICSRPSDIAMCFQALDILMKIWVQFLQRLKILQNI